MLSSNEFGKTTCRTPLRGASRWGTLGGVFCTLFCCLGLSQTGPCFGPCRTFDASDGNPCTVDTCEENADGNAVAVNTPVDCDTQVCNPDDGECVDCVVDADCNEGFCSEAGGNICVDCVTDAQCDDDEDCTTDACQNAQCTHTNVANGTACADDNNECTDDACDDGECDHTNVADGAACDDDSVCTENDACTAGACDGSNIADCCEGNDDCDTAAGETCNTTTNECETPTPPCTVATQAADCDDDDVCTDDTCVNDACVNTNNTAGCDDANFCTSNDVCANGACAGTAVVCPAGQACNTANGNCAAITCTTSANCNDGFSCTADTCNAGTGLCVFTAIDAGCDDGLFCNGTEGVGSCNTADPDAEAGTGCVRPGNPCGAPPLPFPRVCNEATNACDACTTNAQCNDNVPCTSDTCNTGTGNCSNVAVNASCPDPLKCDGDDTCTPADPDADSNGCVQPGNPCDAIGKVCSESTFVVGDLNTCTTCVSNADCSDGVTCTLDACAGAPALCSHTPTNSLCPDAAFCDGDDVCAPADPDANDATGCTNGLGVAYPCANACNENTNACFACTSNADCNDGLTCTDDSCNGATGACAHVDNCTGILNCNVQSGQCE